MRLLAFLILASWFALLRRTPGGSGRPPDTDGRPPQRRGPIDAGGSVTSAQDATAEAARLGRPGQSGGRPDPPGRAGTQWDNVEGSPPPVENIHVTPGRRIHILDGDGDGVGGGHAYGTGLPGKSEFPEAWDDDVTMDHVEDVARNPDQPPVQQDNDRWLVRGTRDNVAIEVIINPDGSIWTAYPTGGAGVVTNDEHGRPIR